MRNLPVCDIHAVAPYVGAWIETCFASFLDVVVVVAPYVGAWIETPAQSDVQHYQWSHPTWVRGLKPFECTANKPKHQVAPYVGAWIETLKGRCRLSRHLVAPYVGAWIETTLSLPVWLRHLVVPYMGAWIETGVCFALCLAFGVAPYVGAWIETYSHNRNPHSYHVLLIVTYRLKQYKPEMCKPQMICIGSYRCCL